VLDLSPVRAYDRNLTVRFGRAPVRSLLPEVLDAVTEGRLRTPTDQVVGEPPLPFTEGPSAYRRAADPSGGTGKLTFTP
jgi:threonine dehydrogenase-like Zn-dependent dehydrogenase